MTLFRRAAAAPLLAVCLLLVSACSISINSASTPTPSPHPTPTPAKPVSVVIATQVDPGRCETNANVTIVVEGRDLGTMSVVNQLIQTDRLTVMLSPGDYAYNLKGTAFLQSNGQAFSLTASGKGQVQVNPGPNSWTLQVDPTQIPPGVCPTAGTTWAMVLES